MPGQNFFNDRAVATIKTLTQYINFFMNSASRCTNLIGNPVKIGSGPAAVTPDFRCKAE
jgi:hypothetical protein